MVTTVIGHFYATEISLFYGYMCLDAAEFLMYKFCVLKPLLLH